MIDTRGWMIDGNVMLLHLRDNMRSPNKRYQNEFV